MSLEDLVDVEPWQAVLDEAELKIWRAEIALSGHRAAATLLARLLLIDAAPGVPLVMVLRPGDTLPG